MHRQAPAGAGMCRLSASRRHRDRARWDRAVKGTSAMTRSRYLVGVPIATVLSIAPVANLIVWMCLLVGAEIAVCLMLACEWQARPESTVVIPVYDDAPIHAMRRIVPRLREHRPMPILEMQLAWRRTAQARRLRQAS